MEQQVKQKYSFEEAYAIVMDLSNKCGGRIPLHEDYERYEYDAEALARALSKDAERSMARLHVRPYAVANIAVLRENRRLSGQPIYIAHSEETAWHEHTSNLFENKYE